MRFIIFVFLSLIAIILPVNSYALPYTVSIDTSAYNGTDVQLALDFIDGDILTNSATISEFSTDGVLGASSPFGDVSGDLTSTLILSDGSFFNEFLQDITIGDSISFFLELTTNNSDLSGIPDSFSLYLLDPLSGLPLFSTNDPTGGDALFAVDITGTESGALNIYHTSVSVTQGSGPTPVPEPSTFILLISGLAGLLFMYRRKGVRN